MKKILPKLLSPSNNIIIAAIYAFFYYFVYQEYILVVWGHFYTDRPAYPLNALDFSIYLALSCVPFILYKGVRTVASALTLFVYLFVYIPFVNALMIYDFPHSIKVGYLVVFSLLMCSFFVTDRIYLFRWMFIPKRKLLPIRFLEYITLLLFIILVVINVGQLKFVNFFVNAEDLYLFREDVDNVSAIYVLCWLRAAFFPLLIVYYLNNHHIKKYMLCIFAYIIIFMLDKQKLTIIFPIAITVIFYISRKYKDKFKLYFHLSLIAIFVIIPILVISFQENPIVSIIAMTIVMRIQCIAGLQMEHYISFFELENNPYTLYGHINIVNKLTGVYPYTESIGKTINTDGSDSNATFLLMDGVAACGILGCFLIGIAFIIVKSMINSWDRKCDIPLCVSLLLFSIQSMLNVSLFTTVFTHGIFIFVVIFYFFNLDGLSRLNIRQ